jgi:GIY-YIG catalytic domain
MVDDNSFWLYNTYMNSKITRKRRTDRNQVIYFIQDKVTLEYYIGLTAVCYAGNLRKTLTRRMQKHMQRALTENKNWGLSRALRERGADRFVFGVIEVVRGKRPAHSRETELINTLQPALNTFGVK